MGSPLDFASSESFRKKLMTRNLVAYSKSPYKPTPPLNYEVNLTDQSVIDSPDSLIDLPTFANNLYPLNQYGSDGGYKQVPDPGALLNTKSNEGEYGFQDANIVDQSLPESQKWKPLNAYSNGAQAQLDAGEFVASLEVVQRRTLNNNQPYPTTFVASFYSPVGILLNPDPQGSDGLLSQDSYIAQLGAKLLKKEFEERIGREIKQRTIDRANIFNANSGTDVLNMLTGIVPLIEPNWTITQPANPLIAATDFALRLAGSTIPVSPIPGSYFDPSINSGQPTTIQQLQNAFRKSTVGKFFNRLVGATQTGSQLFLNNTGGGQKSRLFGNLDYNRYKPGYSRTAFDRLAGAIVGSTTNNSNYYVGSITSEPSRVFSPSGDLPVNTFGQEIQSPVYGPQELAQLYEGPSRGVKLGANGPTYSDGGGIEGGFTWVSLKYKGNAGKKVGIGGEITIQDEDFKPSSYNSTESTSVELKEGSILDDTQRLIDSQPQGGRRLQHVGNAMDQVSKVFNDGYKEITKGSKVLRYIGDIGQEKGTEYCRIFSKDIPYLQYNDLQKINGMTTEGRKFSYSVMDKTYNLNMYPVKRNGGQDSTNLVANNTLGNQVYAKKYMFSLENLAWRTSNKPGFSVSDLPYCERGPNGGRVMWFPPYGLTFNENVTANWKATDFIGRPEPVYTYTNSSRSGSISWKIVVDHPSVLNLIVDKVLGNESNKDRVNSILESFFAGCRTYDLYELAKKYATINPNDLYEIQKQIDEKKVTQEVITQTQQELTTGNNSDSNSQPVAPKEPPKLDEFQDLSFYFDNDVPEKKNLSNYQSLYDGYTSTNNKTLYEQQAKNNKTNVSVFFTNVIEKNFEEIKNNLFNKINEILSNNPQGNITIELEGSASAPQTIEYNKALSQRRIDSVKLLFEQNSITSRWVKEKRLLFKETSLGEGATVSPKVFNTKTNKFENGETITCTDADSQSSNSKEVYTTSAMSCRKVKISNIRVNIPQTEAPKNNNGVVVGNETSGVENKDPRTTVSNTETELLTKKAKPNITKRVLRSLLSECDYFEAVKEETPMVFDNLKEKLKFFNPAFHSTTPEGLNSRLTFLQQCMRPGDTIPVVKNNGEKEELVYNHAINTSFGTPPVLILRIGDFYNTKIIPTGLQLAYESLDINPEGIGIQPMIANVTLNFNFVGGSGLKEAVDRIQNALTFNYYANTEMYDDRAFMTDNSYEVLDKDFLDSLNLQSSPPTINQANNINPQKNSSTIGTIIETKKTETEEIGKIQYSDFMSRLSTETQTYFKTVVNKNREVLKQYNNSVRQLWTMERNYTEGTMQAKNNDQEHNLFGKPVNYQQVFDKIFVEFQKDIEEDSEPFISYITNKSRNFSKKVSRALKTNYTTYIKNKRGSFTNSLTQTIQDITNLQQNYVMTLARTNVISFKGGGPIEFNTDGYQQKNGFVDVLLTTGDTETMNYLKSDIIKIADNLKSFMTVCETPITMSEGKETYSSRLIFNKRDFQTSTIFYPLSKKTNFGNKAFQMQYTILNQEIIDDKKYQEFKNKIIGDIINNLTIFEGQNTELEKEFDFYWKKIALPDYQDENKLAEQFLNDAEKNKLKDYIVFTPYPQRKRELYYQKNDPTKTATQGPLLIDTRQAGIKSLGATQNNPSFPVKTWNDKPKEQIFVSKVKFN